MAAYHGGAGGGFCQSDLLGLGLADQIVGGGARGGRVGGVVSGIPQGEIIPVMVIGANGACRGVDAVIVLRVPGVEFHLVLGAAVVPVQSGLHEDGVGGLHAGVVQGDLLGLVYGDVVGGGGGGGDIAVGGGEDGGIVGGVKVHLQAGGLTDGADGGVGGAVIREQGDIPALGVLGGEDRTVEGDADVVIHGDGAAGRHGRHTQAHRQGGHQNTTAKAFSKTLFHHQNSFILSNLRRGFPPVLTVK